MGGRAEPREYERSQIMMKHGKKLLSVLLAAVLVLAALTACSGSSGGSSTVLANAYTSKDKGQALAEKLGMEYDPSLQSDAYTVANWLVNETAVKQSGDRLQCRVALYDDTNFGYQDDLNAFLNWSDCIGVPMDATIALEIQASESTLVPASLYAPMLAGADVSLQNYASSGTKMGAAFIDCNGTTYVVAVFQ